MTVVRLTWPEAEQAATAGIKRRLLAMHDGRPARYGFKEDAWGSDIEACGAELAVARTLGLFWTPWARRPAEVVADVGDDIQVRRRGQHGWDLLLHPADPDDHAFVLVYGTLPKYELAGWCHGYEGKDRPLSDPYSTGRPAFWVPCAELRPIEALVTRRAVAA